MSKQPYYYGIFSKGSVTGKQIAAGLIFPECVSDAFKELYVRLVAQKKGAGTKDKK